jgi:hypothetical protein
MYYYLAGFLLIILWWLKHRKPVNSEASAPYATNGLPQNGSVDPPPLTLNELGASIVQRLNGAN